MSRSELNEQLFRRIARRDLHAVEDSLWAFKDSDISKVYDPDGRTPLLAAVQARDIKIIKAIAKQQSLASAAQFIVVGGKTTSATYSALGSNYIEAVDFFIQSGRINIASNDFPNIAADKVFNESMKRLVKTRELYSLLRAGNPKLENIESLVKDGAVINQQLLEVYSQKLVTIKSPEKLTAEEISDIKKNTRYLIERGVKVNSPATFLKNAVDAIILIGAAGAEIIDARSTHLAISLLQNSAGFNLDEEQKTKLVKGVLQHDPEYVAVLVSKGWIKPNFKIEGLELDEYAAKVGVNQEIVEAIADHPLQEDLIGKKKHKALQSKLVLEDRKSAPSDIAKVLKGELVAGINTGGEVTFAAVQEDGRTKKFLEKKSDSVAQQFGNEMLRALSNQQYGIKRGVLIKGKDGKPYFATKWDDSVAGGYFLKNGVPENQDKEFVKNYARLCGVVHVLGEHDWNQRNFLKSAKTGRPVKIDNAPLVNGYTNGQYQRIYGSFESNAFLHFLAGEISADSASKSSSPIDKINSALDAMRGKKIDKKKSDELEAKAFIDGYKDGIDSALLRKIKANIAANPDLKEAFIEFMAGVKDSIDLASDKEFLDQYTKKYQAELGDNSYAAAKKCREFLQENAKEAQKQFKEYLEYFAEIAPERSAKTARKIAATKEGEVANSIEEMLASGEVNSTKGVDKFVRKFSNALQDENQALKLFTRIAAEANEETVAHLYDKISALHPNFKNIALFAPVALFPTKISEEKYIEIIEILRDKGCIPANSYAVKNGEELARSIFDHCENDRAATLLKAQFKLPEQNIGKDEKELLDMIEFGNVEGIKNKIKILKDRGINFNGVSNAAGFAPINYAIILGDLDVIKTLAQEVLPSSIARELHLKNFQSSSPLQFLIEIDGSTEVMNYFLEQGYYNLDSIAQYGSVESDSYKILLDTARLKDLTSQARLGALSISSIESFKDANLKALVRSFEIDAATGNVISASEGKSFLQTYVENLSSEKESVKANAANSLGMIRFFVEKGLDINSGIKKGGKSSSLLQYTLDSINLSAKSVNFENSFIAIALIENGAKFDNLTNQQKSKLVRGIMKHQPEYLKNLLDKGVIDKSFLVEKVENGVVKRIPIKTYVADPKVKAPKEIIELFDVAKAVSIKPAVISSRTFVAPKAAVTSRAAVVTPPRAIVSPKVVTPLLSREISKAPAVAPSASSSTETLDAQTILNRAFKLAVKSRVISGDSEAAVLAKFISACQKISKFQGEQKSSGKNISNSDIIAELWPASTSGRPQTPKMAQLNAREQNILSTVALFCDEKTISVNEKGFQNPESKKQVFANLEKLGTAAITEWIDKKAPPLNKAPSSSPREPSMDKLRLGSKAISVNA